MEAKDVLPRERRRAIYELKFACAPIDLVILGRPPENLRKCRGHFIDETDIALTEAEANSIAIRAGAFSQIKSQQRHEFRRDVDVPRNALAGVMLGRQFQVF